jgi:hypothetical protein
MIRTLLVLTCAVALTACSAPGTEPSESATPEDRPVETKSPRPTPSLTPSSSQPTLAPDGGGGELVGVLGADSVEGGCGYLQAADGKRYEVIYPDGWQLHLSPLELVAPSGEIVARGGDRVTVRGAVTTDMMSICQIGPIFEATEVVSGQ